PHRAAGRPAQQLCPADASAATTAAHPLVDAIAGWLGHPERRVAASLVVLGYAARLVGPTLAVLLREAILLDTRPAQVRYAYTPASGFRLTLAVPAGWRGPPHRLQRAWASTVVDGHLHSLIRAVRADTPVAAGLLWGNVASGITGALHALADHATVPLDRCYRTGENLLGHGPLQGSGHLTIHDGQLRFRRRSCCLHYRLAGPGTCGDCPLVPHHRAAERSAN